MSIYDFCDLYIDNGFSNIIVYDMENEEELFNGCFDDIPEEIKDMEIMSMELDNVKDQIYLELNV